MPFADFYFCAWHKMRQNQFWQSRLSNRMGWSLVSHNSIFVITQKFWQHAGGSNARTPTLLNVSASIMSLSRSFYLVSNSTWFWASLSVAQRLSNCSMASVNATTSTFNYWHKESNSAGDLVTHCLEAVRPFFASTSDMTAMTHTKLATNKKHNTLPGFRTPNVAETHQLNVICGSLWLTAHFSKPTTQP